MHHGRWGKWEGPAGFRGGFGGGWGGFVGSMVGAAMRKGKMLSSEELQIVTLQLLAEKPRHGYEIIKAIEEHSSGIYTPSPSMIYPALTYLEELGFAVSKADGQKKSFEITDAGRAQLEERKDDARRVWDQLGLYGKRMAYVEEQMSMESLTDEQWGGSPFDQDKKEWRKLKAEFRELRHELKMAIFEKLSAPLEEKQRVLTILRRAIAEIRGK